MQLRELIFKTAKQTPSAGAIEETLKWGQPSYLTSETKSGSTIRSDAIKSDPGSYALYFHCLTNLVDSFKKSYCRKFRYEGNRVFLFSVNDSVANRELGKCIADALTYHLRKKRNQVPIGQRINKSKN